MTRIAAPDTIEPEDGEGIEGPRLSEEIRGAFGGGNKWIGCGILAAARHHWIGRRALTRWAAWLQPVIALYIHELRVFTGSRPVVGLGPWRVIGEGS